MNFTQCVTDSVGLAIDFAHVIQIFTNRGYTNLFCSALKKYMIGARVTSMCKKLKKLSIKRLNK